MLEQHHKLIRPSLAGIVVLSFLLPFFKITCAGQQIAAVSGIDLVTGKKLDAPSMFGMSDGFSGSNGMSPQPSNMSNDNMSFVFTNPETGETLSTSGNQASVSMGSDDASSGMNAGSGDGNIEPNPFAMAGLACAVITLFASFGATRKQMMMSAMFAGMCAVLLFVMKTLMMKDVPSEMMGVIEINWVEGFWAALVGAIVFEIVTWKVMMGMPTDGQPKARFVMQSYGTDSKPNQMVQQ